MGPLDFLYQFRDLMREKGIRFGITSGMACVYYGLQQNTKDSDWIIHPEDIGKLRELLEKKQRHVPPWRISYRAIFGAPLEREFLAAGWTSHLSIWPTADSPELHIDIFGKPPRVPGLGLDANEEGFVSREVVAKMKRTDRDKDWPIVDGLGWQMLDENLDSAALVHVQTPERLLNLWAQASTHDRADAVARRPLLRLLSEEQDPMRVAGWVRLERSVWECVNRERYRIYTRAWKEFYRRWRKEEDWLWPTGEEFSFQHKRLVATAARHELPVDPMSGLDRLALITKATTAAAMAGLTTVENVEKVCPPPQELWP